MKNIDVREIRMGKWHIPKSSDIFGGKDNKDSFLAIGYFDVLEVKKAIQQRDGKEQENENQNPLMQAYENAHRISSNENLGHSVQEIKAFTNIIPATDSSLEGFTQEQIDHFWEAESFALYISMVHLELDTPVKQVTDGIRRIFENQEYLYYITFDYSGIIVLAKNRTVRQYVDSLLQLNCLCSEETRLVQDTFSVFSLNQNKLKDLFQNYEQDEIKSEITEDKNKYLISVNISVKDFELYQKFEKELKAFEEKHQYSSQKTWLLGRHDISIVNAEKNSDIFWLCYIQYLMNQYSSGERSAFWAYESFVKTAYDIPFETTKSRDNDSWQNANRHLEKVYEKFSEKIIGNYDAYLVPVKEVWESVRAILKNGFAEDFIICMYQSFVDFLGYLIDKMKEEKEYPNPRVHYRDEFDSCFSEYFACLNALVNSAMHSDRQFIQATAFNAIIYDVPPKIMAFYVAMVHNIQSIIETPKDQKYTFLLTPGFSDEISVDIISYRKITMPADRILKVSINERSLYNPEIVIRRMTHEIAHYVGDDCRKRDERKKYILKTLIYIILGEILDEVFSMDNEFYQLLDDISLLAGELDFFKMNQDNYSTKLERLHINILTFMIGDADVCNKISDYLNNKISTIGKTGYIEKILDEEKRKGGFYLPLNLDASISELDKKYLSRLVFKDIERKLQKIKRDIELDNLEAESDTSLNGANMTDYMRALLSLYSETYADLQMILLLDISYDDYLMEFIQVERLNINEIGNKYEDLVRIAVISKLMQAVGLWTGLGCTNEEARKLDGEIRKRQDAIHGLAQFTEEIEEMKDALYRNDSGLWTEKGIHAAFGSEMGDSVYPDTRLYSYLYKCLLASVSHYKKDDRPQRILHLREIVKTMHDFKDICGVYETISSVIAQYKSELNRGDGQKED